MNRKVDKIQPAGTLLGISDRFGEKIRWVENKRARALSREVKKVFLRHYLQPICPSISLSIQATRMVMETRGVDELPSDATFRRWFRKDFEPYNKGVITLCREGAAAWRSLFVNAGSPTAVMG